jgi:hypothetical protein
MDTSILNGKSIQRTFHGLMVVNGSNRKMVGRLADGETFDDHVATITDDSNIKTNPSDVYVFINQNYVDYVVDPGVSYDHEANNLLALFEEQNISYKTFTDMNEYTISSIPNTKKIVIPELEQGYLAPDLGVETKNALSNFVDSGGTLIMFCPNSGDPLLVLNDVFQFNLQTGLQGDDTYSITEEGSLLFPAESSTIPFHSATSGIVVSSLPAESIVIYQSDTETISIVTQIPFGSGKIYVLGWDWYDAAPKGFEDGGWIHLLLSIIES